MNKKLLLNVDFFFSQHSSKIINKSNNLAKWLCLVLLFVVSFGYGQKTWTGSSSTNWHTNGNWSPNGVPQATDNVIIPVTTRSPVISSTAFCNNLIIMSGAILTVNQALTVNGVTTVDGTLAHAVNNVAKRYTGLVTINSGGTWNNSINSAINFRGGITNNGTFNSGTGVQTFETNNQTITGILEMSSVIVSVILTNTNSFTVSNSLGGAVKLINTGILNFGGASIGSNLTLTATADSNTVNYIGVNQTVKATAYSNLLLSGSGTKTFGSYTSSDNLTIDSGVMANLGDYTLHSAKVMKLGGLIASSGIWGSTNSTAAYKNNTFFTTTNINGKIEVGSNNCVLPLPYDITGSSGAICSNVTGSNIGLTGSQIGVNYQLFRGGVSVGSVVAGTGNIISFGAFNPTGTYTIVGINPTTLCARAMTGSVTILSYSSPPQPSVMVTHTTCPTSTTGAIKVTNLVAPSSLAFTGPNRQYVDFGAPMLSNKSSFTVEGWIKFDPTKYTDRMSLFGQNDVIEFGFEGDNLRCWTRNGGTIDFPISGYPKDKEWHHIALVGNGTNLILYFNGVEKYRGGSSTSNYGSSSFSAKIGYGVMDDIGAGTAFTGEVFKLGFWGRALDATEISNMAKGFVVYDASQDGLLAGYSFSEGTGATSVSGVGSVATQGILKGSSLPVWTDPYTYYWTSASGYTSSLKDISNLSPGIYNLTTSLKTCTSIGSWEVKANSAPITTLGIIDAICLGAQGTVKLPYSASIGNPTRYSINWDNSANGRGLVDQANTTFAFTAGGGIINTIAIPANLVAGTYSGIMTIANSTCSQNQTVSLTVNALPNSPTQGTITPATCAVPTGSVVLNGLPATGTWTIVSNPPAVTKTDTGTSTTISGLVPGDYTFTVSSPTSSCTSIASAKITIPGLVTNTWNGIAWSWLGGAPTIDQNVIFTGNYNSPTLNNPNVDINSCTCEVNANVVIKSGRTLTVINSLKVALTASLRFEDQASLYQKNDNAINTGSITYERLTKGMKDQDYVYWSSPVVDQKFSKLSLGTNSYHAFNIDTNSWVWTADNMETGRGYIIKSRNVGPFPYEQTIVFNGFPNNGALVLGTQTKADEYILVGNPYPSALSADEFLRGNKDVLDGTLYFWSHITPLKYDGSKWDYASNDYATYNLSGGVAGGSGEGTASGSKSPKPLGNIAAGQSFFVNAKTGGANVTFKNSMRVAGKNGEFFKPGINNKTTSLEKNRVWLNLTNKGGAFKQMLVGYIEGASNEYESIYDGLSYNMNAYIDFYSINKGQQFVIQGRALPFKETDLVPLGYSSEIADSFTIGIDNVDGSFTSQGIYLEDKVAGIIHNLRETDYTFTTAKGTFNDRFVLRYTNKTLGTGEFEFAENAVLVAVANKEIKINAFSQTIDKVFIYDVSGKLIYKKEKVGNPTLTIENLKSANQVLVVKVVLDNKHIETKKVIF
ncbi:LamG-like jellyroll fold domain-containing protein [Flavobacterium sp. PS2]|uniref:LamG-like jellyroll fold domain-containing protein n=1 Tax=Flavobacterium sp. PS2 TaxID=3384157 RepID=UPI00390CB867